MGLKEIELATEEDRHYKIDLWARFFKAGSWEELKMIAENNTDFQEAITTTYQLSQEEKIRMQCEAREDYYRRTRGRERLLRETILENKKLISEKEQLSSEKERLSSENEQLSSQNEQLSFEKEQLSSQNEFLRKKLAELGFDADSIK